MDFRADIESCKELEKDDKLGFRGVEVEWVMDGAILALIILGYEESWASRTFHFCRMSLSENVKYWVIIEAFHE